MHPPSRRMPSLAEASRKGDLEAVRWRLSSGQSHEDDEHEVGQVGGRGDNDPRTAAEDGLPCLTLACSNGHRAVAELLLQSGADVNLVDADGSTALIDACTAGQIDCVRLLLDHGADPNVLGFDGWHALSLAARVGRLDVVSLLLTHEAVTLGAEAHSGHWKPLTSVDLPDAHGWTALMLASLDGHLEVCKLLCAYGADRHAIVNERDTPLTIAKERGHNKLLEWFEATAEYTTPLHYLEVFGWGRATQLLRSGADPHATSASHAPTRVGSNSSATAMSPYSIACELLDAAETGCSGAVAPAAGMPTAAVKQSAAAAVVLHVEGWNERRRWAMPADARQRAAEVAMIGAMLASDTNRFGREGVSLDDAWRSAVVPCLLRNEFDMQG